MQTPAQKDLSNTQKVDKFASSSLTTGYFYNNQNEEQIDDGQIQNIESNTEPSSQQQLMSPVHSTRRRPRPISNSPTKDHPAPHQQNTEAESPQKKHKTPTRRTYKKAANKKHIQQLQHELETLDDEELQKHDLIMLSKESSHTEDREQKKKEEEVFQLDDLEAEYQVDQPLDSSSSQSPKMQDKKRKIASKVQQEVVFQQSSEDQAESPDRMRQQHQRLPQSTESISSPQKDSPIKETQNESELIEEPKSKLEISRQHMFKILTFPVKTGMLMRTNIERVNGFLFNTYPEYHVYFETDKTHLMSAKRVSRTPFSTFIISRSKKDFEENSQDYLGKAKGSALGDILNLYGKGLSPANAMLKKVKPRELLATVVYETRIILAGQPRNFKVYLKNNGVDYYRSFPEVKIYGQEIPLNLLYQNPHNRKYITVLENKKPEYNNEIKGYSLNFRGRVGMPSVKNFLLERVVAEEETGIEPSENGSRVGELDIMIFGKSKDNIFNMDLSSPLSPLLAFGVALSTFDEKYFCE